MYLFIKSASKSSGMGPGDINFLKLSGGFIPSANTYWGIYFVPRQGMVQNMHFLLVYDGNSCLLTKLMAKEEGHIGKKYI